METGVGLLLGGNPTSCPRCVAFLNTVFLSIVPSTPTREFTSQPHRLEKTSALI